MSSFQGLKKNLSINYYVEASNQKTVIIFDQLDKTKDIESNKTHRKKCNGLCKDRQRPKLLISKNDLFNNASMQLWE